MKKPILTIISDDIRRDLHDPLKYFTLIKVVHFYNQARYNDMNKDEFKNSLKYYNSKDLFEKLAKLKPDIIQGPEPYASKVALRNCFVVLKYCAKYKTPFIFPVLENRPPLVKFGPIIGLAIQSFLGYYGQKAKKIIALNKGANDNLISSGVSKNKITKILWGTWGIDVKEFKIKNLKFKIKKKPVILFVGKVEKQKGILDLLEAFKIIKKKIKNIELHVIGSGFLVNLVKNKPGVKYIGIVKNKNIAKYFQTATVTSVPSQTTKIWAEQVGMVNIQSIACGTPIVSTNSGSIPEYTPNMVTGLLVPEKNSQLLADALMKILLDKKLYKELSIKGRNFVLKNYDAKQNIKKAEKFILELVNNA